MKITKLFIIFSTIFIFNSSLSTNFVLNPSIFDQNLSKSISKIANDATSTTTDTHDILIENLGGNIWSSTINEILKCIDDATAVVVTDLKAQMLSNVLKKAMVIIVAFDMIDGVSFKGDYHKGTLTNGSSGIA